MAASIPLNERPLVYIAGPYSHPDPIENTRLAIEAAERVIASGAGCAFVPHLTLLWHLVAPHPIEYWYGLDLATLRRCDCLLRLRGDSVGADDEVRFAQRLGIPVFTDERQLLHELPGWGT